MRDEDGVPHVFLQWKGTNACLDFYCACGRQWHFDGYFARDLTCGHCGQTWLLPHILTPAAIEPDGWKMLTLVFDDKEVIRDGEFEVTWPRPVFDAVKPGGIFEIHDEDRSAYVNLLGITPQGDAAVTLKVRNRGVSP